MMNSKPLLGCIADDFTGATDLANMLVRAGMRTIQTIGVPNADMFIDAEALVVALKSRTLPVQEAVDQSLAALAWLREQGCKQFFFKYCSTFDSTADGNIGPVTDALLDALGEELTIMCPAVPENGRTVYRGTLFVGDSLLNESGMEKHPLTPMKDANVLRLLEKQTDSTLGQIGYETVARGPTAVALAIAQLKSDGARMVVVDALEDAHLHAIGEACAHLKLVTGGSGIALGLPANFRRAGRLSSLKHTTHLPHHMGGSVVLAGSTSRATNGQVTLWRATRPSFRIDPLAVDRGEPVVEQAIEFFLAQTQPVLIYATSPPEEVDAVQRQLGTAKAGHLIEQTLASIARQLRMLGVNKFVVAGGETSGAVVQALEVKALRIGQQIAPGVPATQTVDGVPISLALKSGNFGGPDFFNEALRALNEGAPPASNAGDLIRSGPSKVTPT
jgi:uncharacterized protein YgbK (DUF1537 family)